jgi:hypothetical protein
MNDERVAERYFVNGEKQGWEKINFREIKKGDLFRLFEPTGESVISEFGEIEFLALKDAYVNEDGIWKVDIL